jgi:hypothetical protein
LQEIGAIAVNLRSPIIDSYIYDTETESLAYTVLSQTKTKKKRRKEKGKEKLGTSPWTVIRPRWETKVGRGEDAMKSTKRMGLVSRLAT